MKLVDNEKKKCYTSLLTYFGVSVLTDVTP